MSQVKVQHKFIHQAPRKLRLVSDMVRGLPAEKAVAELSTLSQAASLVVRKVVMSGIAAARQQGMDMSNLFVSEVKVDEGPKMKRFIPRSRGRSQRILKRMSHVSISLTDEPIVIASSKVYKKEMSQIAPAKKAVRRSTKQEVKTEAPAQPEVTSESVETTEGAK